MPGEHSAGGHGLPYGEEHEHDTDGFGDTLVSASYRLARKPHFGAHATLGVWVPTGSVSKANPDGSFVHYGMQPGSGRGMQPGGGRSPFGGIQAPGGRGTTPFPQPGGGRGPGGRGRGF